MNPNNLIFRVFLLITAVTFVITPEAHAYWVWSPEAGKFVNAEGTAEGPAEEQFKYALRFLEEGNPERAIDELENLAKNYPAARITATFRVTADATIHNNSVRLNLVHRPGTENYVEITTKGLTIAKLVDSQGVPGLDDIELVLVQMWPKRWLVRGSVKGVGTYLEIQKAKSGNGHFVSAWLNTFSPA